MGPASSWDVQRRWIAAVLVAGLLVTLAYTALHLGPKEPTYQGKGLYIWATELQQAQQNYSDPDRWKKVQAATTAIRSMGTNALPFVMADIRARVTLKDRVIYWLAPKSAVSEAPA